MTVTMQERPSLTPALEAFEASRFVRRGGFEVVPQLFSKATMMALFDEAFGLFPTASEEVRTEPDVEDWRGGLPPRQFLSAGGGPAQDFVYQSGAVTMMLEELIGTTIRPSSNRASYSYYCRPGDHIGVHRDVDCCDISVIVAVSDNTGRSSDGQLVLYPERMHDPLSAVRADPTGGAVPVKLAAGETLVIAGGLVPHRLMPVAEGQYRISSPMCFEAVAATT